MSRAAGGPAARRLALPAAFLALVDAGPDGALAGDQEAWRRLLRAEGARRRGIDAWMGEMEAVDIRPEEVPEELPSADLASVRRLAEGIIADRPDDPVADYARLYLMEAVGNLSSSEYDPDSAVGVAFSVMEGSSDPTVVEAALYLLTRLGDVRSLDPAELAVVTREYELVTGERSRWGLASYGLTQAFALQDWEAADRWIGRLEAVMRPASDDRRSSYEADLAAARGQLAAARGRVPEDWRARLVADAWTCHLEHRIHLADVVRASGSWDEGWGWSGLGALPPAYASCLERATEEHPEPGAKEVVLTLFRRASRKS